MIILGHRGAPGKFISENSLPAFEHAITCGADGIEFDVRLSKDHEIIVAHDANLKRIAGDVRKVTALTSRELSKIPLRSHGRILTLQDITSTVFDPMILDIDIKNKYVVDPLIGKLKTSASLRERVIISSYYPKILKRFRTELPEVKTIGLVLRWPLPLQKKWLWKQAKKLDVWSVGFPLRMYTPKRIAFIHSLGFKAAGWDRYGTKKEAERAVKLGLDIVIVKDVDTAVRMRYC